MTTNHPSFASVWDAIEATPQEAANMKARALLLMAVQAWLAQFEGTQKDAAILLAVTQPRLSDLKRGHIELFSLDALMNIATAAGLAPTVQVTTPRLPRSPSPAKRVISRRVSVA
jgi:predicted XRE-type DNA-binding protein